jgi:hypothetical protein
MTTGTCMQVLSMIISLNSTVGYFLATSLTLSRNRPSDIFLRARSDGYGSVTSTRPNAVVADCGVYEEGGGAAVLDVGLVDGMHALAAGGSGITERGLGNADAGSAVVKGRYNNR